MEIKLRGEINYAKLDKSKLNKHKFNKKEQESATANDVSLRRIMSRWHESAPRAALSPKGNWNNVIK